MVEEEKVLMVGLIGREGSIRNRKEGKGGHCVPLRQFVCLGLGAQKGGTARSFAFPT